jgi:hypothetical protein
MHGVRLKIRLALGDASDDFVFRSPLLPPRTVGLEIVDAAAVVEYLRDGDSVSIRNLRKEFVESVGEL